MKGGKSNNSVQNERESSSTSGSNYPTVAMKQMDEERKKSSFTPHPRVAIWYQQGGLLRLLNVARVGCRSVRRWFHEYKIFSIVEVQWRRQLAEIGGKNLVLTSSSRFVCDYHFTLRIHTLFSMNNWRIFPSKQIDLTRAESDNWHKN